MSTTLLSAFYDIDFLCKTEKSLSSLSSMLDKKAVGSPVGTSPSSNFAPGFLRRHSTSNLQALANGNAKFPGGSSSSSPSSFGNLKEPGTGGGGGGGGGSSSPTALLNKENKFRDRSFSENGERSQHLMQQLQQQQVVVVSATTTTAAGKGGGGNNGGGGGAPINSTRYKTELCRPFEESGACKYGEKCQFAHGFHELRSLTRHPKYKTELCRTFHTIGFCPYGPRCHFIHNADERRPAPANGNANPPPQQQQPPSTTHQPSPQPPPPHSSSNGSSHHGHHHHHPLHPPHAGSTGDLRAFAPSARDHPLGGAGGGGFGIPHPRGGGDRPKLHHSLSFSGFSAHHHHHHHGGAVAAAQGGLEAAAAALLLESPGGSRTPPASGGSSYCEELVASPPCANNAFAFSGQELGSLIAPLAIHAPPPQAGCFANAAAFYTRCHQQQGGGGGGSCCPPPGPPASPPFSFQPLRRLSESPVFDAPPSPPDSLSDRESYLSGSLSSGSLSGSESPSLDSGRRLPIFSRLSISDD